MLKLSQSDLRVTRPGITASDAAGIEEGAALTTIMEAGEAVVHISNGVTTERFAGFALSERTAPLFLPNVEALTARTVDTGTGFDLAKTPAAGLRVAYTATNVALTATANAPGAGEYKLVGNRILVNVADLNKGITTQYTFVPSAADLYLIGGDNTPTTISSMVASQKQTSVIKEGVVFTSFFDPAIDWTSWVASVGLKAAANGMVTTAAGTGVTINGEIIHAPDTEESFLGISFRAF